MRKFKNRQDRLTYMLVVLITALVVYYLLNWATQFNQYTFAKALTVILAGALSVDYISVWVSRRLGLLK